MVKKVGVMKKISPNLDGSLCKPRQGPGGKAPTLGVGERLFDSILLESLGSLTVER